MKYIRTKDGIYERMLPDYENSISFDHKTIEPAYYTINHEWVAKKDVNKQADTIEKLCDAFVIVSVSFSKPYRTTKKWVETLKQAQKCKPSDKCIIYGAIWIVGENNEPILKSVARMNDKGELELL